MRSEQSILRLSIAVTFALAGFGVIFGVLTGSSSIIFDGIYSAMDASMTMLALLVSRLITQSLAERTQARLRPHFTMGFWHLEPMVLGLSGSLLIGAAGYALVTAVSSLMAGASCSSARPSFTPSSPSSRRRPWRFTAAGRTGASGRCFWNSTPRPGPFRPR